MKQRTHFTETKVKVKVETPPKWFQCVKEQAVSVRYKFTSIAVNENKKILWALKKFCNLESN